MNEQPKFAVLEVYRTLVETRRGDRWLVKPEAEGLDGQVLEFSVGWLIADRVERHRHWRESLSGAMAACPATAPAASWPR